MPWSWSPGRVGRNRRGRRSERRSRTASAPGRRFRLFRRYANTLLIGEAQNASSRPAHGRPGDSPGWSGSETPGTVPKNAFPPQRGGRSASVPSRRPTPREGPAAPMGRALSGASVSQGFAALHPGLSARPPSAGLLPPDQIRQTPGPPGGRRAWSRWWSGSGTTGPSG
jgi:hypothetical protein